MYNLGLICYKEGALDGAIDRYKSAIKLDPKFADAHYNLGLACYKRSFYPEAIEAYLGLLELKPDYENGHSGLGLVYMRLNRSKEALEAFQKELSLYPHNPYTHVYLGETYLEMKEDRRALDHFRQALRDGPPQNGERIRTQIASIERRLEGREGEGLLPGEVGAIPPWGQGVGSSLGAFQGRFLILLNSRLRWVTLRMISGIHHDHRPSHVEQNRRPETRGRNSPPPEPITPQA